MTAALSAGAAKEAGSAFDISQEATVAEAANDVRQRDLNAAFVPTPDPKRPATLIVASANGRIIATAAKGLARQVAAAQGAQVVVREVRPLPSGDEIGLGIFLFMVVCTICGYITPTVLETVTPGLLPNRRYPIIAVTSLLIATLAYLIGGLGYGTYTGSFGTVLAFIGVGAIYTLTIGLGTRLFQVLLGPPGSSRRSPSLSSSTSRAWARPIRRRSWLPSGSSSTTSGSARRRSTPSAASSTSAVRGSALT